MHLLTPIYSASSTRLANNQFPSTPSETDPNYTTLKVVAYKDQHGAVLLSPVKRNANDRFSFIKILSDGKAMKKCGMLYDEILKSKSVASRNLDYGYMKTLDVIRRSNLCERRRWVQKKRHETKNNIHDTYEVEPLENQSKSQKKRDPRNNTNKVKAEIQRKSLQQHMKKRKDVKEGISTTLF